MAEGRPFYFRARHGDWALYVGPVGALANFLDWWEDAVLLAEGEDDTHGWMEVEAVRAILDEHLAGTDSDVDVEGSS